MQHVRLRSLVTYGLFVGSMLIVGSASATVSNTYLATRCHGTSLYDEGHISFDWQAGTITANTAAAVVCPFIKQTSGPNITNDELTQVQVFKTTNKPLPSSCTVDVMFSALDQYSSNWAATVTRNGTALGASIDLPAPRPRITDYWWDSVGWFYPVLTCQLSAGQSLASYKVTEAGTTQSTQIYPGAWCQPTSNSVVGNYMPATSSGPGGFVHAPGGSPFEYACFLPGWTAQFSVTPTINSSGFGVSSSGAPYVMQPGSYQGGAEFPSLIYPSTVLQPQYPLTTASNGFLATPFWNLFFHTLVNEGDMGIVSYRTTN